MKIFIASYTYIYEHNYKIFDYFKNKENFIIILPSKWKSTKGERVTVYPKEIEGFKVIKTPAPFYHSHYPIIRGQLKGWMPFVGRILKKHAKKGDIFYSSFEPNLLATYLYNRLARKLGLKHIFFTWQNVSYRQRLSGIKLKMTEWFLKENFRLSYGGLFGTKRAFEVHEPYLRFNPDLKYAIIPQTGINTDIFRPDIDSDFRKKYNLEGKLLFLFAATFTERKGVIPTLTAFSKVSKIFPETHLVMVGTGNLANEVKNKIEELRLSERVTLLPWLPVNDLAPLFASMDILVHPSQPYQGWEEQFGLLILQAQSCGIPVIATKSGSLEESILDEKTGILVEPQNTDLLADKMINLAQNPEIRKKLGQEGRNYILNKYSYRVVAEKTESFFKNL